MAWCRADIYKIKQMLLSVAFMFIILLRNMRSTIDKNMTQSASADETRAKIITLI